MNLRVFSISLFLLISTAVVFVPATEAQSNTIWSFCTSDGSNPVIYFSPAFDSGMSGASAVFDGTSLGMQFTEYLKGRFDAKGSASCTGRFYNEADLVRSRQRFMAQMRQQNKQVVEVPEWTYVRDEVAIKSSLATPRGGYVDIEGGLPEDHIYCLTDTFQNTVYYTGPFPKNTNDTSNWSIGFFKYLQQKYSFRGDFRCQLWNETQAKLFMEARLTGAKAGGKQVVDTGWRWEPSAAATQAPAREEDREPVRTPAVQPPTASAQVRDLASKEVMPALHFCQNNRAMSQGYNCECLQLKISAYRKAHPADTINGTPPLESLFDGEQFDCSSCIRDSYAKMEARTQARSAGLKLPAAQECVSEKFVTLLHAKPSPSHAKDALDAAIKACR